MERVRGNTNPELYTANANSEHGMNTYNLYCSRTTERDPGAYNYDCN